MEEQSPQTQQSEEDEEEIVCLDQSFFMDRNYQLTSFKFGSHEIRLLCLQAASTDYDLTGQLVWPGAMLLNDYFSRNAHMLEGCTIIELGSGVGITGILCSRFFCEVLLTDHNDEVLEILRRNIELQTSLANEGSSQSLGLAVERLEWGDVDHINKILEKYPKGFDLIIGADICFQQSSIYPLFDTVEKLLRLRGRQCRFILAYVSRTKRYFDALYQHGCMVINVAFQRGMRITEVPGTRSQISNLEGVIYEITL